MTSVKKFVKNNIDGRPKKVVYFFYNIYRSIFNAIYDYKRFYIYSWALRNPKNKEQIKSRILFYTHSLEKGLVMPNPKKGFGEEKVFDIIKTMNIYVDQYGLDDFCDIVFSILKKYKNSPISSESTHEKIDEILNSNKFHFLERSGFISKDKKDIFPVDKDIACAFLKSRHSIRSFNGDLIDRDMIFSVIDVAKYCPSVCNRQSALVFVANEKEQIEKILSFQNGNSGFGQTIGAVFLIAVDLQAFMNPGERNQAYVDGGIFALSLANSLHAHGLGGCMLNWSQSFAEDKKLRKFLSIPDNFVIITMLGAGVTNEGITKIAASPRKPTENFIKWVN